MSLRDYNPDGVEDAAELRAVISDLQEEVMDLDETISDLEDEVSELEAANRTRYTNMASNDLHRISLGLDPLYTHEELLERIVND